MVKRLEMNKQAKIESNKILLARLESLHEKVYELAPLTAKCSTELLDLRKKENSFDRHLELFQSMSIAVSKAGSPLRIYAPEFNSDFEDISTSILNLFNFGMKYLQASEINTSLVLINQKKTETAISTLLIKIERKIQSEVLKTR